MGQTIYSTNVPIITIESIINILYVQCHDCGCCHQTSRSFLSPCLLKTIIILVFIYLVGLSLFLIVTGTTPGGYSKSGLLAGTHTLAIRPSSSGVGELCRLRLRNVVNFDINQD